MSFVHGSYAACLVVFPFFIKRRTNILEALIAAIFAIFLCICLWTISQPQEYQEQIQSSVTIALGVVLIFAIMLRIYLAFYTSAYRVARLAADTVSVMRMSRKLYKSDAKQRKQRRLTMKQRTLTHANSMRLLSTLRRRQSVENMLTHTPPATGRTLLQHHFSANDIHARERSNSKRKRQTRRRHSTVGISRADLVGAAGPQPPPVPPTPRQNLSTIKEEQRSSNTRRRPSPAGRGMDSLRRTQSDAGARASAAATRGGGNRRSSLPAVLASAPGPLTPLVAPGHSIRRNSVASAHSQPTGPQLGRRNSVASTHSTHSTLSAGRRKTRVSRRASVGSVHSSRGNASAARPAPPHQLRRQNANRALLTRTGSAASVHSTVGPLPQLLQQPKAHHHHRHRRHRRSHHHLRRRNTTKAKLKERRKQNIMRRRALLASTDEDNPAVVAADDDAHAQAAPSAQGAGAGDDKRKHQGRRKGKRKHGHRTVKLFGDRRSVTAGDTSARAQTHQYAQHAADVRAARRRRKHAELTPTDVRRMKNARDVLENRPQWQR